MIPRKISNAPIIPALTTMSVIKTMFDIFLKYITGASGITPTRRRWRLWPQ